MSAANSKPQPHLRYAILGTGALGGYYGIMLAASGADVQFIARSDYEHIREHGLKLQTKERRIDLKPVSVVHNVQQLRPFDILIIATKTTENAQLRPIIQACPWNPTIVLLQNGLGLEEDLEQIAGEGRVLGGCCFLCSNKVAPGEIHHLDYGRITLGWPSSQSAAAAQNPSLPKQLQADFNNAGITLEVIPDLIAARWRKLMWNIPYNGLSVALNASTQDIMNHAASSELVYTLMEEVRAAAQACGKSIEPSFTFQLMEQTKLMVPYDSSMRVDYLNGRPLELEAIYGRPLKIAQAAGYHMPSVLMLYQQLQFLSRAVKK